MQTSARYITIVVIFIFIFKVAWAIYSRIAGSVFVTEGLQYVCSLGANSNNDDVMRDYLEALCGFLCHLHFESIDSNKTIFILSYLLPRWVTEMEMALTEMWVCAHTIT